MSLRDRLAKRQPPTASYALRVDDDTAARAELAAARAAGDEDRIVAAQTAIEACYEQVTLTVLPPLDMEALIAAHPPPEGNREEKIFNSVTFTPALFAACVDSDVTEEDWAQYIVTGAMTIGEVTELFNRIWDLNYRGPDPSVPKD